jgi:hypothetical protein
LNLYTLIIQFFTYIIKNSFFFFFVTKEEEKEKKRKENLVTLFSCKIEQSPRS